MSIDWSIPSQGQAVLSVSGEDIVCSESSSKITGSRGERQDKGLGAADSQKRVIVSSKEVASYPR